MSNTTQNYNADARLRAIAMNAVREAMLVYQRWDRPFTDDDAARMHDIYMLLHLQDNQAFNEHAPLVEAQQLPVSEAVLKVASLLGNELVGRDTNAARNLDEADAAPVPVTLPKAARPKETA